MAKEMKNIDATIDGDILTLKIDLTKDFGPSKSGKTVIIASSAGTVPVEGADGVKMGVNVFKKKE